MLNFDSLLRSYNDLNGELLRLKNISNLNNGGYFESLLSNSNWHIYFLYRIKDKWYFDYFLLDRNFWEEAKNNKIIKNNEIGTKDKFNYMKSFELFDKLKDKEEFVKYFNEYKSLKLDELLNKQEMLSFTKTINILHKLKKYKPDLEIDFFDLDIEDYYKFSTPNFTTKESIISEYLRKGAIYDFDFEKFYLLKREELDKKILKLKDDEKNRKILNDVYHNLGILNTYYRFYKLYNSLVNLSYLKIFLLKIINAGNIFDENRKYLLSLLIFHFSKTKSEANKIWFIFKDHFIEFIIFNFFIILLLFGNIQYVFIGLLIIFVYFIIVKLILNILEEWTISSFVKTTFALFIIIYGLFSFYTNFLVKDFITSLPQSGLIGVLYENKKIDENMVNKGIKDTITKIYMNLQGVDAKSNILGK